MKAGNFLKYFILAVVAANIAIVACVFLGGLSIKPTPLPNPNGYDDFVKAGQLLNGSILDYGTMSRDALTALISQNENALRFLRIGLTHDSRIPADYSIRRQTNMASVLMSFKSSAFLLTAEGRLAELDGRTNDAAKIYLDTVRFGQASSRGGVIIDRLVGTACEIIGLRKLQPLSPVLPAKNCAEIARALEDIDAREESPGDMIAQEKIYVNKTTSFPWRVAQIIAFKDVRDIRKKSIDKLNANTLSRRQVMLNFAARAYELDQGHRPTNVADLVPTYLNATPKDPVTGADLAIP
jgi:hypothetical protein